MNWLDIAKRFGFANDAPNLERRTFLKGLLATGALAVAPSGLLVPTEPKIYQVGGIVRADDSGLQPVVGQPGLFRNKTTGEIVNLRDFRETDKYDTVEFRVDGLYGPKTHVAWQNLAMTSIALYALAGKG